ncbi:AraC family transcriptional regulator [Anaerosacchariphilus polymeriproducens]|uniref:AraC family transcriptional regulator n=1 Tax=Anaerosacchariphilus polymeriproducens TaxID=1812858 RepID=A0A371AUT0_9FIRM|nr:AraC family transcriptional regulator [Anaerosacchariphilus polymeriproducens]RDU23299.1 AraC family transcriptional regulator [Anaerosacchariphilus polymeriproducens]
MSTLIDNQKKGYLYENFRLFHLKDKSNQEFEYHFHDFDKIIIFLSGTVTYLIEGKAYYLKPWDILLVNHHDIHRPIIDAANTYERIIIWIKPDYIEQQKNNSTDITACFTKAIEKSFNLIRLESDLLQKIQYLISELETALLSEEFGSDLLSNSLFIQFMVYLNRIFLREQYTNDTSFLKYDKQTEEVIRYINQHLSEPLSNQKLAHEFYLSKYYLMHKFKEETGYSIHNYILHKRLLLSVEYLKDGIPVMKAAQLSGFGDYSSFLRSFRKLFHKSPRDFMNSNEMNVSNNNKKLL